MASEIIIGERGNGSVTVHLLYAIPANKRIEIGGTGTTGKYPVISPTSGFPDHVLDVLTQGEKDALDAGEAYLKSKSLNVIEGTTDAQLLTYVRQLYANNAAEALEDYEHRFQYIGRRFDAS